MISICFPLLFTVLCVCTSISIPSRMCFGSKNSSCQNLCTQIIGLNLIKQKKGRREFFLLFIFFFDELVANYPRMLHTIPSIHTFSSLSVLLVVDYRHFLFV